MNHTPGPWRVVIDDDGNPLSGRPSVCAAEELDCAIVHWDGFAQTYWRSARGEKEMHANARLIAAAPDLLEACRAVVEAFDALLPTDPARYSVLRINVARAAIAKAT